MILIRELACVSCFSFAISFMVLVSTVCLHLILICTKTGTSFCTINIATERFNWSALCCPCIANGLCCVFYNRIYLLLGVMIFFVYISFASFCYYCL